VSGNHAFSLYSKPSEKELTNYNLFYDKTGMNEISINNSQI